MKTVRRFLMKNKHFLMLLYGFIYVPWFCWLEKTVTVTSRYHVIHTFIDDYIPFCEFFIIPYYLWFAYMAVFIAYFAFRDPEICWKMGAFLITGMTLFLVISTFYPNGHQLRPDTFSRDNLFVTMVQQLYATDTPTNLFPSIHVYNSLGIHFAVINSRCFKQAKWIKGCSFALMLSIILSTMLLKQHSVFDVITALALAAFMYSVCYGSIAVSIARGKHKKTGKPLAVR